MSNDNFKCGPHPHSHGGWYPGDIHTGPCHPCGPDLYHPGVPGPTPSPVYPIPHHPGPHHHGHIHPHRPPRPDNMKYVTKREFNEVLQNIFANVTFSDTSINGTTVTVGGIEQGTKFSSKLTLPELVKLLLFPENITNGDNNTDTSSPSDSSEFITVNEFNEKIKSLTDMIEKCLTTTDYNKNIDEVKTELKKYTDDTVQKGLNSIDLSKFVTTEQIDTDQREIAVLLTNILCDNASNTNG